MISKSDNKFDHELIRQKKQLDKWSQEIQKFISTHASMPVREKALALQSIQRLELDISIFLSRSHSQEAISARQKFALENLKSSFSSNKARWIKFERSLG